MSGYLMSTYFARAMNLLYPLIGIDRGEPFTPECYLYWPGEESIENYELICYYNVDRDSDAFRNFEKQKLLSNSYLKSCYRVKGGMVYVFDMIKWSHEVGCLLAGKYSMFTNEAKRTIYKHWGDPAMGWNKPIDLTEPPTHWFHMVFNPHLYYKRVSKVDLNGITTPEELEEMGELWSPVDKEKETLNIEIEDDCSCVIQTEFSL